MPNTQLVDSALTNFVFIAFDKSDFELNTVCLFKKMTTMDKKRFGWVQIALHLTK